MVPTGVTRLAHGLVRNCYIKVITSDCILIFLIQLASVTQ